MQTRKTKFMVDQNVGKLSKLLRLMGYDTAFFTGENDTQMVNLALAENRVILTRDTHILKRRSVTSGRVRAILIKTDNIEEQIKQVVDELNLHNQIEPFILCLECNRPLTKRTKEEVQNRVPPYVWQTQKEYMECLECHRIYWKGTHWEAMTTRLQKLTENSLEDKP
jgi:uncharacterized protein